MTINDMLQDKENHICYSEDFILNAILLHEHLLKNNAIQLKTVEDQIAYKYEGDFYGLLQYLQVPKRFNLLTLLLNNLTASDDYKGVNTQVLLYNMAEIDLITNLYVSV